MKDIVKGNLAMGVSKTFSGLNQNALKILVPDWMSPFTGVVLRVGFGSLMFWLMGLFRKDKATAVKATTKQKLQLLLTGIICVFGYMACLLVGLSYTTPIASSILLCLEPITVFLIMAIFYKEKVTLMKVIGIAVGIGGAIICVTTQKSSHVATNPLLGDAICALGAVLYSVYLVISARFLKVLDNITVSKWTFTGALVTALVVIAFLGWHAPVLTGRFFSLPMMSLLFVLIFPTTISYILLDIGMRYLKPTVVALYGNVIIVVAAIVSYILGQDIFSWWQVLAIAMIIVSMYFVEVAERK